MRLRAGRPAEAAQLVRSLGDQAVSPFQKGLLDLIAAVEPVRGPAPTAVTALGDRLREARAAMAKLQESRPGHLQPPPTS